MPEERRGRVARNAARPMIEAIVKGVCMWCGRVERGANCGYGVPFAERTTN
jgi:hypothetical protein